MHIAILVENQYQETELWYSRLRFREAGARVTVVGPGGARTFMSTRNCPIDADIDIADARVGEFDAVIVPGGWAPDAMRLSEGMVSFVREMWQQGKIVGAICHGTWLLCDANIARGRRLTSTR